MNKLKFILLTAALVLATAFTFSCSSDDSDPPSNTLSSSVVGGSSSSVVGDGSSSSGGGGGTAPTITTTTLAGGTVGIAYSQTLTATGDTPITWSNTGTLPAGLTLSTAGVITGTPTTEGTSTFTVKATNATGNDEKSLSIVIINPIPTELRGVTWKGDGETGDASNPNTITITGTTITTSGPDGNGTILISSSTAGANDRAFYATIYPTGYKLTGTVTAADSDFSSNAEKNVGDTIVIGFYERTNKADWLIPLFNNDTDWEYFTYLRTTP